MPTWNFYIPYQVNIIIPSFIRNGLYYHHILLLKHKVKSGRIWYNLVYNLVSGYDPHLATAAVLDYQLQNPDDLEAEEGIVPIAEGSSAENPSHKFQCLKCFMTFSHLSSAKRHYRNRHLNSETATCKFCKRVLKNIDSLNEHVRTIHGISKKQLKARIIPTISRSWCDCLLWWRNYLNFKPDSSQQNVMFAPICSRIHKLEVAIYSKNLDNPLAW